MFIGDNMKAAACWSPNCRRKTFLWSNNKFFEKLVKDFL